MELYPVDFTESRAVLAVRDSGGLSVVSGATEVTYYIVADTSLAKLSLHPRKSGIV